MPVESIGNLKRQARQRTPKRHHFGKDSRILPKCRHGYATAHDAIPHFIRLTRYEVLSTKEVWMRLEGALSASEAAGLGIHIQESLQRSKNKLVLDL
jgi:hypothetical protein